MLNSLYYFWFPGLVITLFCVLKFILGFQGENLEWATYFIIFFFFIIYFFIYKINYFPFKRLLSFILSIPFYFYFLLNYQFEFFHFVLLFLSLIFIFIEDKKFFIKKNFFFLLDKIIIYFVIFFFASKLFFWLNHYNDLIFYKFLNFHENDSKYIDYANLIEIFVPIVFFTTFILSSLFILFVLANKDFIKFNNIFFLIIPFAIFFFESFSSAGFFNKIAGGPMFHWQPIIGPNQMLQQGGFLLWDTPTNYGYLSHLVIDLIPLDNKWLSFYYLNGTMMLIFSLIFFIVVWNFRNFFLVLYFTWTDLFYRFFDPIGRSFFKCSRFTCKWSL